MDGDRVRIGTGHKPGQNVRQAGEDIPRKGGPAIRRSDILVVNKTDLAPYVGANLEVMKADAARMRGDGPVVFASLKSGEGVGRVVEHIVAIGGLVREARAPA